MDKWVNIRENEETKVKSDKDTLSQNGSERARVECASYRYHQSISFMRGFSPIYLSFTSSPR